MGWGDGGGKLGVGLSQRQAGSGGAYYIRFPLAVVPGVDHVSTDEVFHLVAVYYDTDALDLAANRITLRRRTGGKDDGWHLKLPDGADRREVTVPLDDEADTPEGASAEVPEELVERVRAVVRGRLWCEPDVIDYLEHRQETSPRPGALRSARVAHREKTQEGLRP